MMLVIAGAPAPAAAQDGSAVLSGRVIDGASGAPIAFASVVLERTGARQTGTLSGDNGRFVVKGLAPGAYKIHISFPGYHPSAGDVLVSALNQAYDFGDIKLDRLEGFREEVTVTADTLRAEGINTQLFRLADGPAPATGTLLDALKTLPGVTVDQEGKVSLRGSDQVAILIDGRQPSLTGFGSQRGLDSVSAPTSSRSRSSTTRRRASTPPAWPASSTSSTSRNGSRGSPAMRASASTWVSSRSSATTCPPTSAASRLTARWCRAST